MSRIIPTIIGNTGAYDDTTVENKFNTTDLIYLDSFDEQYAGENGDEERRISATDYAQMNNACIYDNYETRTGRQTTWVWLRSASYGYLYGVNGDGNDDFVPSVKERCWAMSVFAL